MTTYINKVEDLIFNILNLTKRCVFESNHIGS